MYTLTLNGIESNKLFELRHDDLMNCVIMYKFDNIDNINVDIYLNKVPMKLADNKDDYPYCLLLSGIDEVELVLPSEEDALYFKIKYL